MSCAALKSHGRAIAPLSTWLDKRRGERQITHGNGKTPGTDELLKHWIPRGLASLHGVNWTVLEVAGKHFLPLFTRCISLIPCNPFAILPVAGFCAEEHDLLWGSCCVAANLRALVALCILAEARVSCCTCWLSWGRGENTPQCRGGLPRWDLRPSAFLTSLL